MEIWFDGKMMDSKQLSFEQTYRAFFFGDGLFESIYADQQNIYLFDEHIKRISEGLRSIHIESEWVEDKNKLLKGISSLINHSNDTDFFRIKIAIWRKGKGTYNPNGETESHCLITCEKSNEFSVKAINNYSVSDRIKLFHRPASGNKSLSSISYVLASIEKTQGNSDIIFITDSEGNILETESASIMLIKGDKISIPIPGSGQVSGVMMQCLLESEILNKYQVTERKIRKEDISNSDLIITCNSFIMNIIKHDNSSELMDKLNNIQSLLPKRQLLL